ncbi:AlkA N-terminal domain-containing protein [Gallaecimonas sp. GXIMD1310]|uniref:AlkA N-terminal domain-containing protein n=1 Tax=Gallaecimonas sp. GXIMD1310 TaxID=3131926 RepID=UPI00324FC88A
MNLDEASCYQALISRDHRFDGRFYAGVLSTGIYCRPVCPARKPSASNCRYFRTAAAAEQAGFRPCLKCRPERAPGCSWHDSSSHLARRAEAALRAGTVASITTLAAQLQTTPRHLRRVFQNHFGVTPVAYRQTQRLLLAKTLLTDTRLPISEVAMAAGFGSLRRFNALFAEHYRLSPGQFRRHPPAAQDSAVFTLAFRPPLDWPALLHFLGQRCIDGVEQVIDGQYQRTLRLPMHGRWYQGWLSVCCAEQALQVTVSSGLLAVLPRVLAAVRQLFDVDAEPAAVQQVLGSLAHNPGLRAPGAVDGLEMAVRAILGQQITVAAARTLAGRVARLGPPATTPFAALTHYFPDAALLAQLAPAQLAERGVIGRRAQAIIALAQAVHDGLTLDPSADPEHTQQALQAIAGIGPWTASYITMRALHWPDAWPYNDHGLKMATGLSGQALAEHMMQYRPWRAYATLQLWSSL